MFVRKILSSRNTYRGIVPYLAYRSSELTTSSAKSRFSLMIKTISVVKYFNRSGPQGFSLYYLFSQQVRDFQTVKR